MRLKAVTAMLQVDAQGCPWDAETCSYIQRGHLAMLQWARDQGCPWDEHTCAHAAHNATTVLQWRALRAAHGTSGRACGA